MRHHVSPIYALSSTSLEIDRRVTDGPGMAVTNFRFGSSSRNQPAPGAISGVG